MSRLDDMIEELRSQLQIEIEAAYQRGLVDGAADMRARILSAAQVPAEPLGAPQAFAYPKHFKKVTLAQTRAPRGAVGAMLHRILKEKPGLSVTEIEAIAPEYDPEVAAKSIGNELRRFDGVKYQRRQDGKWFLFDGPFSVETETPAESSAGVDDIF